MNDRFDIFGDDDDDDSPIYQMCSVCGTLKTDVYWTEGRGHTCATCS